MHEPMQASVKQAHEKQIHEADESADRPGRRPTRWPRWPHARLGIDIDDTAIRVVALARGRRVTTLMRWANAALPSGAVHDGRILQPAPVARALRQCLGRGRWPRAVLALPGHQSRERVAVPPAHLSADALPRWIEDEARGLLSGASAQPADADTAHCDGWRLAPDMCEGADMPPEPRDPRRFQLVAADRRFVDERLAIVEHAGLRPAAIDVASYALRRAFAWGGTAVSRRAAGGSALAWFGAARLWLAWFDGAQCLGECAVPLGMEALDLSHEPHDARLALMCAALRQAWHTLAAAWPAERGAVGMQRLWLGGVAVDRPNTHATLSDICGVPIAVVDPFDGYARQAAALPLPPPSERAAYLLACGLAMHGEVA